VTATHDDVKQRAYECWQQRGCPIGSPEVDWWRAEQELSTESATGVTSGDDQPGIEQTRTAARSGRSARRQTAEQNA